MASGGQWCILLKGACGEGPQKRGWAGQRDQGRRARRTQEGDSWQIDSGMTEQGYWGCSAGCPGPVVGTSVQAEGSGLCPGGK